MAMELLTRQFCVAAFLSAAPLVAAAQVSNTARYHDDQLGLTILTGELQLPVEGIWTLAPPASGAPLRQVYSQVTNWAELRGEGNRALANRLATRVERDGWKVNQNQTLLRAFAARNGGRGPAGLNDPALLAYVADPAAEPTRPSARGSGGSAAPRRDPELEAQRLREFRTATEDLGLVPDARFRSGNDTRTSPVPVLLELAPAVDDGLHWVLFSDGLIQRVPVDQALLQRLGFSLSPKNFPSGSAGGRPNAQILQIYASLATGERTSSELVFTDSATGRQLNVSWDWSAARPGTREMLSEWASLRAFEWTALARVGEAPLLRSWIESSMHLYGAKSFPLGLPPQPAGGDGGQPPPSFLTLLGGRAAVQETLQLQSLRGSNASGASSRKLPMAGLKGVEVKPHPFPALSSGKSTSIHQMARLVPLDRAFFHADRPAALTGLFAPQSAFVERLAAYTGGGLNYQLLERYSADLGLTRPLAEALLGKGLLEECAVFVPDLFFADGTDVTLIVRVASANSLRPLLQPFLGAGVPGEGGGTVRTDHGFAHWAIRGDLWMLSTRADELARSLALLAAQGEGSLGQSAEFRYMVDRLPPTTETQAFIYFSDPFIRRLVSPAVKIGQLRRMQARVEMERLVGAALLRQLDVGGPAPTKEALIQLGYLAAAEGNSDLSLHPDCTVHSAEFGPLAHMKPLSSQAASLARVSPGEAAAYATYLESYQRFWRQYFDPIALRFDAAADGWQKLTTFILPLIESSAYNDLRRWLPLSGPEATTQVPLFDRPPAAQLGLVLPDKAWRDLARDHQTFFESFLGLPPEFYDLLGPSLHVAIEDGDPILRLGSGDLAGILAGGELGGGRGLMVYLPVLLNLLTRPTHLAIELTDPARASQLLLRASARQGFGRQMEVELYRQSGDRGLLLSLRPFGLASLDFSLRVEDRYLIISNHPFGQPLRIKGTTTAGLAGATVRFQPAALATSLPADFASAMRSERARALAGLGYVYPWMLAQSLTAEQAEEQNRRTLGFLPSLPAGGVTRGFSLEHNVFGSVWQGRLPEYRSQTPFGVFAGIAEASVSMQFEEDGLRTELRWKAEPQN